MPLLALNGQSDRRLSAIGVTADIENRCSTKLKGTSMDTVRRIDRIVRDEQRAPSIELQ